MRERPFGEHRAQKKSERLPVFKDPDVLNQGKQIPVCCLDGEAKYAYPKNAFCDSCFGHVHLTALGADDAFWCGFFMSPANR